MLGTVDDQLTRLHLNSRNVSVDEVSVVNRLCGFQTLPNRLDHQRFDVRRRHSAHGSGSVGCAVE
jgi:hypothetical protein